MAIKTSVPRTLRNRKGKTLTTVRTDKEAFDELERQVQDGQQDTFAADLVYKGARNGLSEEQFWWVHKLLEPRDECMIPVGNITHRMHAALDAGASMRSLKVELRTSDDQPVKLAMAGSRSKYSGDVWVTDDGAYPDNRLYGRIEHTTGVFKGHNVPVSVQDLLRAVQSNPDRYLPW